MRKMKHNTTGAILNIKEHIILTNYWEYYVTDLNYNDNSEEIVTALVMGAETELGDVYLPEIKPYIISRTKELDAVFPAENYSWI